MNSETVHETKLRSVYWEDERLYLLDQRKLPNELIRVEQTSVGQVWDSINKLVVRGAPAIGITGAYGLCIAAKSFADLPPQESLTLLKHKADYLSSSRPTAVNLSWALHRMIKAAVSSDFSELSDLIKILIKEAESIHKEDMALCRGIGEAGLPLMRDGMGILTHCNAGALAASILGTATAPLYLAHEKGISFRVYADETRPLLQGARLTSWELMQAGIDITLICDSMAAALMASSKVDLVIVGTDRVSANGDVANKIGTYGLALLADRFGIPFYVACPSSTVDTATAMGKDIPIEERDGEEIRHFGERRTAPPGVKVWNPAFDVTPHELVRGLITEKGILSPPYSESLKVLLKTDQCRSR